MLSGKERAEIRSSAATIDTTLIIGKSGITPALVSDADAQLTARGILKGKVLETALLSAREASDFLCSQLNADGISCLGNKFVIFRKKPDQPSSGSAVNKKAGNPVKTGIRRRRAAKQLEREKRNAYFKQKALEASIEKSKARKKAADRS